MIEFSRLPRSEQVRRLRRLARHALAEYGYEPASVALLSHLNNTTFAVTAPDGARYTLRIQRVAPRTTSPTTQQVEVESEMWLLERLRVDLDLPVPSPMRTPRGDVVVRVEVDGVPEPRLCVLFRRLDGRFLHNRLTPAHLERVGRMMARLHQHSAQLVVPDWFRRPRVDQADGDVAAARVRLFRDRWSPEGARTVDAVQARVRAVQDALGRTPDTFGLIHADIHQENYLFGGGEVRLIDFDDSGWGHYVYDLTVTVHNIDELPRAEALRQALFAGYRQIRELSREHEAMVDTFYVLRELQMLTWFLEERSNPSLGDRSPDVRNGLAMMERFLVSGGRPVWNLPEGSRH